MDINRRQILKTFRPTNVFLAVAIGVTVSLYFFFQKTSSEGTLGQLYSHLTTINIYWVGAALLVLVLRDFGYIYRLRNLTQKELSWNASIYTVLLWEFASAVTPSVVGGTAVAVFILNKEKIPFGKSLAYVMLTAILDNMYFLTLAPLVLFLSPGFTFPVLTMVDFNLENIFWVSYTLILVYTLFMATGVFLAPRVIKWVMVKSCSYGFLKKWKSAAMEQGNEIQMASKEFIGKNAKYWFKAIGSSGLIWTARYLMLNCLISAFNPSMSLLDQTTVFGNQIIMWIAQLLSPTPGSGGFAEVYFNSFFGVFLAADGLSETVGFVWRFMTSYLYLIIGAFVLRRWIRRVFFGDRKLIKFK